METKELVKELTEEELQEMLTAKRNEKRLAKEQERKDYEAEKDLFINATVEAFKEIQAELITLKTATMGRAEELWLKMFELNDKEYKPQQSMTVTNSTDTLKVVVESSNKLEFNEEAIVHINTIKDIFKEAFEGANPKMYHIMVDLLTKNKKGEYDPKLLTKVRKSAEELNDPKLTIALSSLEECQKVTGTAQYCRAYYKDDKGKWQDIPLQFSGL